MCVAEDGRQLYTGGADKTVRIWQIGSGEQVKVLAQHADGIVNMAVIYSIR